MLKERLDEEERLRQELENALKKARKDAEEEMSKKLKMATAEVEQSKLEELEKLRKKHDMLNMGLEEDAKRKQKHLQDELDEARSRASELAAKLQVRERPCGRESERS